MNDNDKEPGEDIMLNIFEIILPALMIAPLALAQTVFPSSMPELNPQALHLVLQAQTAAVEVAVSGAEVIKVTGLLDPNNINSTLNSIQTEFEIPGDDVHYILAEGGLVKSVNFGWKGYEVIPCGPGPIRQNCGTETGAAQDPKFHQPAGQLKLDLTAIYEILSQNKLPLNTTYDMAFENLVNVQAESSLPDVTYYKSLAVQKLLSALPTQTPLIVLTDHQAGFQVRYLILHAITGKIIDQGTYERGARPLGSVSSGG